MPPNKEPKLRAFTRINKATEAALLPRIKAANGDAVYMEPRLRDQLQASLRPLVYDIILNALEGRGGEIPQGLIRKDPTKLDQDMFGFEWEAALEQIPPTNRFRKEAVDGLLKAHGTIRAILSQPIIMERNQLEWLYDNTVGRINWFTPHLTAEERALDNWRQAYASIGEPNKNPWAIADIESRRQAASFLQKNGMTLENNREAYDLAYLGYMVAARKLFLVATQQSEYFENDPTVATIKVPRELQERLNVANVYVRLGNPKAIAYPKELRQEEIGSYQIMLNSHMFGNLEQKLCPWASDNCVRQCIGTDLLAKAYYHVLKPQQDAQAPRQYEEEILKAMGGTEPVINLNRARLLRFRNDLTPGQLKLYRDFTQNNPRLKAFLQKPEVASAFVQLRLDKSIVELMLNHSLVHTLIEQAQAWEPKLVEQRKSTLKACDPHTQDRELALALLGDILKDQTVYHNDLIDSTYLAVSPKNYFKEKLFQAYQAHMPEKERQKWHNFRKIRAVVLVAKPAATPETPPPNWNVLRHYDDKVTGTKMTDYTVESDGKAAIICMRDGASFKEGWGAVQRLWNPDESPRINDPQTRIKGVRMSEHNFNEFRSSCLEPVTIAHMQFYTSFGMRETLDILKGTSKEPSLENVTEALHPCLILKYDATYSRVKPVKPIRVKYRTPTNEKRNPCWDASRWTSALNDKTLVERHSNPEIGLIMIEGEKKAALLTQMVLEKGLPYHVLALPGVWMGLKDGTPKGPQANKPSFAAIKKKVLVPEIAEFVMQNPDNGTRRKCVIMFDNDKDYKPGVMEALIQTGMALQREGAAVFVPNLPFGKKIKGADDFAYKACRKGGGLDYGPLIDVLENSILLPDNPPAVKYPNTDETQEITRQFEAAETVHELQDQLKGQAADLGNPAFRQLFNLQAPLILKKQTTEAEQKFRSMPPPEQQALGERMLKENPHLQLLRTASRLIPSFTKGTTLKDYKEAPAPCQTIEFGPDLFKPEPALVGA